MHATPFRRLLAAAAPLLALSGCEGGVLDPKGPVGASNRLILVNSVEIMLAIVIPTILVGLWFAWWYRASNTRAHYQPNWAYSGRVEFICWAIPILVIMFLGGVIWIGSYELDPFHPLASKEQRPLDIQVVSLDWKWLFIYPDQGVASVNELVVPAGVPVHFYITSASVMNMFFVPQLGSMIAAMYGMVTQLHLEAEYPGNFYGQSAQYSGDGFSGMHFTVHAIPIEEFGPWIERVEEAGPTLDHAAYRKLLRQSENVVPYTYSAVSATLFHDIVTKKVPEGPGPTGGGEPNVHEEPQG